MPVEQVINIQEETGIFICLIRKIQVSEELAIERFVRRVVTDTFPQVSKLKSACQLPASPDARKSVPCGRIGFHFHFSSIRVQYRYFLHLHWHI